MKTIIRRTANFLLRCASAVVLGGSILVLTFAGAQALGFAQMTMHNSGSCALYSVTSGGNLHVGCKGDPTMPKSVSG